MHRESLYAIFQLHIFFGMKMSRVLAEKLVVSSIALSCALACTSVSPSSTESETELVLRTVDDMFRALTEKDTEKWKELMHPDGVWFIQTQTVYGEQLIVDQTPARIRALAELPEGIVDTYTDPEIRIDESIATFWATYTAYDAEGVAFACGTDAFQLVKTGGRWRIANIMFTQRPDCTDYIQ